MMLRLCNSMILFAIAFFSVSASITLVSSGHPAARVDADGRITFTLDAPKARSVALSIDGRMGNTEHPMQRDAGEWSLRTQPLPPGFYLYNFIVDGLPMNDPASGNVGRDGGVLRTLIEVPGGAPRADTLQDVPRGRLRIATYVQQTQGWWLKRLYIYTPPGYDENPGRRYSVGYLLHGAQQDEWSWMWAGRAPVIADNLIATGKAEPMILVSMFIVPDGPSDSADPRDGAISIYGAEFEAELLRDVVPYVDEHYRTIPDSAHRALVGLSRGGEQAFAIGLNHLDAFGWIAGFSSAIWKTNLDSTFGHLVDDQGRVDNRLRLLFIACGADEGMAVDSRTFSRWLDHKGIDHVLRTPPGGHSWHLWRANLAETMVILFKDVR